MRTRTFVLSFLVHSLVIGMVMVVRTFATTEMPDPPMSTKFMMAVTPEVPEVPPPQQQRPTQSAAPTNEYAMPLKPPDAIAPEVPHEVPDTAPNGPGAIFGVGGGSPAGVEIAPPPPPRVVAPPAPSAPLHVGGVVRPPQKIHHVAPTYPAIAQSARVSGVVILEALIAEDGSVREVKVLRSVPLLDAAATDAVRQWRFTPTLLNGVPVQVIMTVTVTFNLN
jgi:protein TonB